MSSPSSPIEGRRWRLVGKENARPYEWWAVAGAPEVEADGEAVEVMPVEERDAELRAMEEHTKHWEGRALEAERASRAVRHRLTKQPEGANRTGKYPEDHPLIRAQEAEAKHDFLYLAVEEEVAGLRAAAERERQKRLDEGPNHNPTYPTTAEDFDLTAHRLQEALKAAGEKREVPDYGLLQAIEAHRDYAVNGGLAADALPGADLRELERQNDERLWTAAGLSSEQKGGGSDGD